MPRSNTIPLLFGKNPFKLLLLGWIKVIMRAPLIHQKFINCGTICINVMFGVETLLAGIVSSSNAI